MHYIIIWSILMLYPCTTIGWGDKKITSQDKLKIGKMIWYNESRCSLDGLMCWNDGEDFASLGIGHFIWYPQKTQNRRFEEVFPSFIRYAQRKKAAIPLWLLVAVQKNGCPWPSRDMFLSDTQSKKKKELQKFLQSTIPLQTDFIIQRFFNALAQLEKADAHQKERVAHIKRQLRRMMADPRGMYTVIDYCNFKGIGSIVPSQEKLGWGLFDVLGIMHGKIKGKQAITRFCTCAKKLLLARVEQAAPGSKDAQWYTGWCNRINTYEADDPFALIASSK